jgi:hypothetical protein
VEEIWRDSIRLKPGFSLGLARARRMHKKFPSKVIHFLLHQKMIDHVTFMSTDHIVGKLTNRPDRVKIYIV